MANRGSILATNDYLRTNDYLVSANGQFCAIMQSDGNLCVYRGTTPSVEGYVWSWMDAYSHLFRDSSSFFDTIGNGLKSVGSAFRDLSGQIEGAGKAAWQATSETAAGLAEGAERAGVTVSDSFIAGAEATRSALETGAEATRQGLVDMGHYINQHACSIGVGSALTATVTTMLSSGVGTPQLTVLATAAGRSGNEAALKGTVQAFAHVLAEPISLIPIPGFHPSREELQTVIAFLITKALKGTKGGGPPGEIQPGFWGGVLIYGLTEFICSGKLPGGYSMWRGAQAEVPVA